MTRVDARCTVRMLLCLIILIGAVGPVSGMHQSPALDGPETEQSTAAEPRPQSGVAVPSTATIASSAAPQVATNGANESLTIPREQVTYEQGREKGVIEVTHNYSQLSDTSLVTLSIPADATVIETRGLRPRSDLTPQNQDNYQLRGGGAVPLDRMTDRYSENMYLYDSTRSDIDAPTLTYRVDVSDTTFGAAGDEWVHYASDGYYAQSTAVVGGQWPILTPEYRVSDHADGVVSETGRVLLGDVTTSRHTTGAETITVAAPTSIGGEVTAEAWADINQTRETLSPALSGSTIGHGDALYLFYLPTTEADIPDWGGAQLSADDYYFQFYYTDAVRAMDAVIAPSSTSSYTNWTAQNTREMLLTNRFHSVYPTKRDSIDSAADYYTGTTAPEQYSAACINASDRRVVALANLDYRLQSQHNTSLDAALTRSTASTDNWPSGRSTGFLSTVANLTSPDYAETFNAVWVGDATPAPWNETKHRVVFGQPNGSALETTSIEAVIEGPDGTQSRQTLTLASSTTPSLTAPAGSRITLNYSVTPEQSMCAQTYNLSASAGADTISSNITLTPGHSQTLQVTQTLETAGAHTLQPLPSQPAVAVNVTSTATSTETAPAGAPEVGGVETPEPPAAATVGQSNSHPSTHSSPAIMPFMLIGGGFLIIGVGLYLHGKDHSDE